MEQATFNHLMKLTIEKWFAGVISCRLFLSMSVRTLIVVVSGGNLMAILRRLRNLVLILCFIQTIPISALLKIVDLLHSFISP